LREWDIPVRTWTINLRPKLDAITEVLSALQPTIDQEVDGLEHTRV
jgi:hypothetical protein